jgi:hypothetical protein
MGTTLMSFEKIGSLVQSTASSVALRRERPESESEDRLEAAERHAAVMLSAYRKIDCDDPEAWTTATVAILARYPADVMAELCHPQSGIQTRIKWPPVPQEIREHGDIAMDRKLARDRRAQLAQHRVLLNTPRGLLPEPVAAPILEEERKRTAAAFDALQDDLKPSRKLKPPNMELLKPRPVEALSPAARATNIGRDWGAPDITYGPARPAEAAE